MLRQQESIGLPFLQHSLHKCLRRSCAVGELVEFSALRCSDGSEVMDDVDVHDTPSDAYQVLSISTKFG